MTATVMSQKQKIQLYEEEAKGRKFHPIIHGINSKNKSLIFEFQHLIARILLLIAWTLILNVSIA